MRDDVDGQLAIVDVVARLRGNGAALLAAVVEKLLKLPRNVTSVSAGALLVECAKRSGAGNLLASIVVTATVLDAINNGLQVDEVASSAIGWTEARASAVDTEGTDRAREKSGK